MITAFTLVCGLMFQPEADKNGCMMLHREGFSSVLQCEEWLINANSILISNGRSIGEIRIRVEDTGCINEKDN